MKYYSSKTIQLTQTSLHIPLAQFILCTKHLQKQKGVQFNHTNRCLSRVQARAELKANYKGINI